MSKITHPGSRKMLPESLKAIFHRVDNHSRRTNQFVLQFKREDGTSEYVVDLSELLAARPADFNQMLYHQELLEHANPALLKKLCDAILRAPKRSAFVVDRDGHHLVRHATGTTELFVWRGRLCGLSKTKRPFAVIAVPTADRTPVASCDLPTWIDRIGRHLVANDYPLVALCFAISSLTAPLLDQPRLTINLVGRSSTGKTSLIHALMSLIAPAKQISSASGTINGIRAQLLQHVDQPGYLDELQQCKDLAGLKVLIFDFANGASRVTSSSDQKLRRSESLRCVLIMNAEHFLVDGLHSKRIAVSEGFAARLLEIDVKSATGVFEVLPDGMTSKSFSEYLSNASRDFYGAFWDRWVETVATNAAEIKTRYQSKLAQFEAKLSEGFDIKDAVTQRMVRAMAAAMFAGYVAAHFKLLPTNLAKITAAMRRVLMEHLDRQKDGSNAGESGVVSAVREVLDQQRHRFAPLGDFYGGQQGNLLGYRRDVDSGIEFLFFPPDFEKLFGERFGTRFAAEALLQAGFLKTDAEGFQKLIRVPGGPHGFRKRFYVIRGDIQFEERLPGR